MCVIVAKPQGKDVPNREILANCEKSNPHGIGIMYYKADKPMVHIKKDFRNAGSLHNWLKQNITKEDTLVIHFRYATSGKVDKGNRHPFPITRNKSLLRRTELICQRGVVHNGVLSQYGGHHKYSDTQKFTVDILADPKIKRNLGSKAVIKLIREYINGDKLAILANQQLILIGEFIEDKGILYSNTTYKTTRYRYFTLDDTKDVVDTMEDTLHSEYEDEDDYVAFCDMCNAEIPIEESIEYNNSIICIGCYHKLETHYRERSFEL